jgi:hypothetical protein
MAKGDKADQAVAVRFLAFAVALDLRKELPNAKKGLAQFGTKPKTAALDALRQELKSKTLPSGSLDTQLVKAARGVWEEANPRRDLF